MSTRLVEFTEYDFATTARTSLGGPDQCEGGWSGNIGIPNLFYWNAIKYEIFMCRGGWTRVMFHHSVMWLQNWQARPHTGVSVLIPESWYSIIEDNCKLDVHLLEVGGEYNYVVPHCYMLLQTLSSCHKPANTVDHVIFLCWDHWSRSHVIQKSYNEKSSVINYFNGNTTHHKEIELYDNWQYGFVAILLK